jgi:hypothetical protein
MMDELLVLTFTDREYLTKITSLGSMHTDFLQLIISMCIVILIVVPCDSIRNT